MWHDIKVKVIGGDLKYLLCAWKPETLNGNWTYEVLIHWPDGTWTDSLEFEVIPAGMPDFYKYISSPNGSA
jgi:hypothetical protein